VKHCRAVSMHDPDDGLVGMLLRASRPLAYSRTRSHAGTWHSLSHGMTRPMTRRISALLAFGRLRLPTGHTINGNTDVPEKRCEDWSQVRLRFQSSRAHTPAGAGEACKGGCSWERRISSATLPCPRGARGQPVACLTSRGALAHTTCGILPRGHTAARAGG